MASTEVALARADEEVQSKGEKKDEEEINWT
jgi:hypothetical protein